MEDSRRDAENQRRRAPWSLANAAAVALAALVWIHPAIASRDDALVVVAAALALGLCLAGRDHWPPTALRVAAGAWLAGLTLSVVVAGGRPAALWNPVAGLTLAAVGWSLGRGDGNLARVTLGVAAGAVPAALLALSQHLGLDPLPRLDPFPDRVVGPFLNPNHLGSFCAVALPLLLGRFLHRAMPGRPRRSMVLWGAVICVTYAALLLAGSRGGFYATLAGVALVGLGGLRRYRQGGLLPARLPLLALTAALAVTTVALQHRPVLQGPTGVVSVAQRFEAMGHLTGEAAQHDFTVLHRRVIWRTAAELFGGAPWLGVGPGNFAAAAAARMPAAALLEGAPHDEALLRRYEQAPDFAHNELLNALAESGLAGALPALALVLLGLTTAIRGAWRHPDLAAWGAVGACVAAQVHGLVSYPSHMPATSSLYWILFGITIRLARIRLDADTVTDCNETS